LGNVAIYRGWLVPPVNVEAVHLGLDCPLVTPGSVIDPERNRPTRHTIGIDVAAEVEIDPAPAAARVATATHHKRPAGVRRRDGTEGRRDDRACAQGAAQAGRVVDD